MKRGGISFTAEERGVQNGESDSWQVPLLDRRGQGW
jgi:hypothetical protein